MNTKKMSAAWQRAHNLQQQLNAMRQEKQDLVERLAADAAASGLLELPEAEDMVRMQELVVLLEVSARAADLAGRIEHAESMRLSADRKSKRRKPPAGELMPATPVTNIPGDAWIHGMKGPATLPPRK